MFSPIKARRRRWEFLNVVHQVWNGPLGPSNTEIKRSILQILDFILGSEELGWAWYL